MGGGGGGEGVGGAEGVFNGEGAGAGGGVDAGGLVLGEGESGEQKRGSGRSRKGVGIRK